MDSDLGYLTRTRRQRERHARYLYRIADASRGLINQRLAPLDGKAPVRRASQKRA